MYEQPINALEQDVSQQNVISLQKILYTSEQKILPTKGIAYKTYWKQNVSPTKDFVYIRTKARYCLHNVPATERIANKTYRPLRYWQQRYARFL